MSKVSSKVAELTVQGSAKAYNRRKTTINLANLRKIGKIARAFDNELRVKLLNKLSELGESSVQDIYGAIKIEQSVCSQHLAILRAEDIVMTRREGKKVFYSVNLEQVEYLEVSFDKLLKAVKKESAAKK